MKAPDKVFVHTGQLGFLYASKMNITGNDTEYIHKDALLEWAKEMKRICRGAEPIEKAYQTMIDKINSL